MCTNLNTNTIGLGFKGKRTNEKQVLIRISLMCTNDNGRTDLLPRNRAFEAPPGHPVSSGKPPRVQTRCGPGSNTRDQIQICSS